MKFLGKYISKVWADNSFCAGAAHKPFVPDTISISKSNHTSDACSFPTSSILLHLNRSNLPFLHGRAYVWLSFEAFSHWTIRSTKAHFSCFHFFVTADCYWKIWIVAWYWRLSNGKLHLCFEPILMENTQCYFNPPEKHPKVTISKTYFPHVLFL